MLQVYTEPCSEETSSGKKNSINGNSKNQYDFVGSVTDLTNLHGRARQKGTQACKQKGKQITRQAGRQAGMHTGRHANGQAYKKTGIGLWQVGM